MAKKIPINQVVIQRELLIRHSYTESITRYTGSEIDSITPLGVVVAVSNIRILFPWSRVLELSYHMADVECRKSIQGF